MSYLIINLVQKCKLSFFLTIRLLNTCRRKDKFLMYDNYYIYSTCNMYLATDFNPCIQCFLMFFYHDNLFKGGLIINLVFDVNRVGRELIEKKKKFSFQYHPFQFELIFATNTQSVETHIIKQQVCMELEYSYSICIKYKSFIWKFCLNFYRTSSFCIFFFKRLR